MTEFDPQSQPPPAAPDPDIGPLDGGAPPVEVPPLAEMPDAADAPDNQNQDAPSPDTVPMGQAAAPIDDAVGEGEAATHQNPAPELPELAENDPRPAPPYLAQYAPQDSWREQAFGPRSSEQAGLPVRRGGGTEENPDDRIMRIVDQRIAYAKSQEPPEEHRINPYASVFPFQSTGSSTWKELINSGLTLVPLLSGRVNMSATGMGAAIPLGGGLASGARGLMVQVPDVAGYRFIALAAQQRGDFELDVVQNGGTQGVLTSASQTFNSFKYKCMMQGTSAPILALSASPTWARPFPGPVNSATHGVGYYDKTDTFRLARVDEQTKTSIFVGCSS